MTNSHKNPQNFNNKGLTDSNRDRDENHLPASTVTSESDVTRSQPEMAEENFKHGYLRGRQEQRHLEEQQSHNNRNKYAGRGLVLGISLISLLIIGLGLILLPEWIGEEPANTPFDEPEVELEVE
ncbi:MAG: hypothetical protein ACLFV6_07805 [Spirulinaceae cyanobacterium]